MSRLLVRIEAAGRAAITVPAPGDLRFTTTAPGGYDAMSCTIPWPRSVPAPSEIDGAPCVDVVDRATGQVVWHGRIADPGGQARPGMSGYAVLASGQQTVMDTSSAAYALVDRDLASWAPLNDLPVGTTAVGPDAGTMTASTQDTAGVPATYAEVTIPQGAALASGATASWVHLPSLRAADSRSGIVQVTGSSKASTHPLGSAWETNVKVGAALAAAGKVGGFTTPSGSQVDWAVMPGYTGLGGSWSTTLDGRAVVIESRYTGTAITAAGAYWERHSNLAVYGRRFTRGGVEVRPTVGVPKTFEVTVTDVVLDVLGRLLVDVVEPAAVMESPTTVVPHAAWWDGVSARQVMEFVATLAPYCWWGIWERGTSGRPRFTFESWRRPVRYVVPPGAGDLSLGGGADNLANAALVIYLSGPEQVASVTTTVTVPVLDAERITRTVRVDVRDRGPISAAKAVEIGQNALADRGVRKTSGSVRVSGPILDRWTGRMVSPWEIRPGCVVHVPDASDRVPVDLDTPDGASLLRLTSVRYDASSDSADLGLDGGSRTLLSRVRGLSGQRYATTGGM